VIAKDKFILLSTLRKNGTAVAITVWFAHLGDGIVVGTGADAGKVKRLRNNPSASFAPFNYRGKLRCGSAMDGTAKLLEGAEARHAEAALRRKYGWQWRLAGRRVDTFFVVAPS
jgi:PPOX class probable F420-dependent enzyme